MLIIVAIIIAAITVISITIINIIIITDIGIAAITFYVSFWEDFKHLVLDWIHGRVSI